MREERERERGTDGGDCSRGAEDGVYCEGELIERRRRRRRGIEEKRERKSGGGCAYAHGGAFPLHHSHFLIQRAPPRSDLTANVP